MSWMNRWVGLFGCAAATLFGCAANNDADAGRTTASSGGEAPPAETSSAGPVTSSSSTASASATSTSTASASSAPKPSASMSNSPSPPVPDVFESNATVLTELGGTYLCDQRIYPAGGGRHISAWEWAFKVSPNELAKKLEEKLPGAARDGLTFRYSNAQGAVEAVIDVRAVSAGSMLNCPKVPAGTKSFVVASHL